MPKSEDDDKIWDAYAKGVKQIGRVAKPLPGTRSQNKTKSTPAKAENYFRPAASALRTPVTHVMKKGKPFQELLDRRTERQLKQGTFLIDARLDLHGMTQAEAYTALERFMGVHIKTDHRHLLIITGKGRDGTGALRNSLAGWLETFASSAHILGLRPAAAKHGGGGAFYLILRRRRQD